METFVPLYISNICDSFCSMCNMRKNNSNLKRIAAEKDTIEEQLHIIRDIEGIYAVCFLSGERLNSEIRRAEIKKIIWCINKAYSMGFKKVFFNCGSFDDDDIDYLKNNIIGEPVLSLFQETYDRNVYQKYFGRYPDINPKSDFDKRYQTPLKWILAGFTSVDIGILVGFKTIGNDLENLNTHITDLRKINKDADIHISLPRIKNGLIDDTTYRDLIIDVRNRFPGCKIILTTRESTVFINNVIKYIDIISPGCSDICPYTRKGNLYNNVETSQFVINNVREKPSTVLNKLNTKNITFYKKVKNLTDLN